ncbi:DUF4395 domain-containing protein [Rhodococcus sp. 14C212]|uniref:DUF4395 domain-containing protein n=1 Tax=Rhodococcus sp. 14C212 TaxID=2711209 RepID=UPI0013ED0152|nr:DUF4395 domain-containing protein [Rhodococcus sp. 14C212]NGP07932.1 DUF4395 domain-containing protein [Rhodococcus sp. 14C212]
MSTPAPTARQGQQVDVRGPRFAAWITTAVLVVVLAVATVSTTVAGVLLAVQTAVFAAGAALGPRRSPYGLLFARLVAPRLSAPTEKEPVAPLRFAQLVGFVFAAAGTFGFLLGADLAGLVATGFALFAALLNAAFGVCLGCAIYPLVARFRAVAA